MSSFVLLGAACARSEDRVIPSAARNLALTWARKNKARFLAALGMTPGARLERRVALVHIAAISPVAEWPAAGVFFNRSGPGEGVAANKAWK
jgi:hypothetical protein